MDPDQALIFCKKYKSRSGPTKCRARSGSKLFDTLMVFPKVDFLEKKKLYLKIINRRQLHSECEEFQNCCNAPVSQLGSLLSVIYTLTKITQLCSDISKQHSKHPVPVPPSSRLIHYELQHSHGWASAELPRNRVNVNLFLRHFRDLSR